MKTKHKPIFRFVLYENCSNQIVRFDFKLAQFSNQFDPCTPLYIHIYSLNVINRKIEIFSKNRSALVG